MASLLTSKRFWLSVLLGLGFFAMYLSALERGLHERSERSLNLTDDVAIPDHVGVSVSVIRADPTTGLLVVRLRFLPAGNIAQDIATPRIKLRFFTNNSAGERMFEFPEGEGMDRIETTLPMEGDINKYPFDKYQADLWLLMDTPEPADEPKAPHKPQVPNPPQVSNQSQVPNNLPAPALPPVESQAAPDLTESPPAEIVIQHKHPIPLSISVSASTPGIKYGGEVIRSKDGESARLRLTLKRPYNLVNVAIVVMCLMMGIALSIVAMILKTLVSRRGRADALPLSLSIGLIFGLPALRNIQPGVPPVGVLGDYISFIWAELFIAAAAIIAAWMWVVGSIPDQDSKRQP